MAPTQDICVRQDTAVCQGGTAGPAVGEERSEGRAAQDRKGGQNPLTDPSGSWAKTGSSANA